MERIECDGQDQCPDHQGKERGEDPVTKHDQDEDQSGTDQHIEQKGSQPLFECLIKLGGYIHGPSSVAQVEL